MPEIVPATAPMPRAVLGYDGTDFRVFIVDTSGHIQADVLSSALPTGAATDTVLQAVRDRLGALTTPAAGSTNKLLTDALTALQLIDNLQAALQSVNTDALQVRGENQLWSYAQVLGSYLTSVVSGADGYCASPVVPAGQVWIVTTAAACLIPRASTVHRYYNNHDAFSYLFHRQAAAFAAAEHTTWSGITYLDPGDDIRVYFTGAQAADTGEVALTGYRMTLEV